MHSQGAKALVIFLLVHLQVIVLVLFVTTFLLDKAMFSTPQWILLPMFINRIAAFFAIWRDLLYVAVSPEELCT